ncbi:MAG: FtsX-like permease family protein [Pseudomonadota bacterium]
MRQGLVATLAWRLLVHSANRFARFVTWVSFLGLSLGVMLLTVVVTVMNGFDHELKSRLLMALPHITIQNREAQTLPTEALEKQAPLTATGNYFRGLGAATAGPRIYPITLYGFEPRTGGNWSEALAEAQEAVAADPVGIALGRPLARILGARVGDMITVVTAQAQQDAVQPRVLKFRLSATFSLGAEPDYNLALVNLQRFSFERWRRFGEVGTQIQLVDPLNVQRIEQFLQRQEVPAVTWEEQYGELFRAVQLEKSMMFLLLLLVVAIAAFNIIAGQSMLVNDKRRNIAILQTMGCKRSTIRNTFLLQGLLISIVGTILGLGSGLLAAYHINEILDGVQLISGMHLLDGSFFVRVPVKVLPLDIGLIAFLSCGLCLLSAWLPARRASLLDPIHSLHA